MASGDLLQYLTNSVLIIIEEKRSEHKIEISISLFHVCCTNEQRGSKSISFSLRSIRLYFLVEAQWPHDSTLVSGSSGPDLRPGAPEIIF